MFDFNILEEEDKTVLRLDGELTIENAASLHEVIKKTLQKSGPLVLDLENVTSADLSCLQLLYSSRKTCDRSGREFSLGGNCAEPFRNEIRNAGFTGASGCGFNCSQGCIWIQEDKNDGQRD